MPPTFWLYAALILLPVLFLLLYPLWQKGTRYRHSDADDVEHPDAKIGIKAQLEAEFRRDYEAGLTPANYKTLVEEADTSGEDNNTSEAGTEPDDFRDTRDAPRRLLAAVFIFVVALGGAAVYYPASFDYEMMALLEEHMHGNERRYKEKVGQIRESLQNNPDDADLWIALAGAHAQFGNYSLAISAYGEAEERRPLTIASLLGYAEAIILGRDIRSIEDDDYAKAETMVNTVLGQQPQNMAALWWSGVLFDMVGDYASAINRWRAVLTLIPGEAAAMREQLQSRIEIAEKQNKQKQKTGKTDDAFVEAIVRISDKVLEHTAPGHTVLIYAKAIDGPPMPLAVVRVPLSDLPTTIRLDKQSAMIEGMAIDNFDRVEITARVSENGQAIPHSGEPFGVSPGINPARGERVEVVIDRRIP